MPGAGSKLLALDAPAQAVDDEATDETAWTNTSYDSGSSVCGTTFTAPTSGAVLVLWSARLQCGSTGQRALASVSVATGGSVGAGSVVSASSDDSAIETSQSATVTGSPAGAETRTQAGMWRVVTGLTAGSTYNVVVQKKVFGGSGSIFQRNVAVLPIQ